MTPPNADASATPTRAKRITPAQYGRLSRARWLVFGSACMPLMLGILWIAAISLGREVVHGFSRVNDLRSVARAGDSIPAQLSRVRAETTLIDSLLSAASAAEAFNQSNTLSYLYAHADSSGCSAARVTMGETISTPTGTEIPFTVSGKGTYQAFGAFMESVENMRMSTRVRSVNVRSAPGNGAEFVVDFVVME